MNDRNNSDFATFQRQDFRPQVPKVIVHNRIGDFLRLGLIWFLILNSKRSLTPAGRATFVGSSVNKIYRMNNVTNVTICVTYDTNVISSHSQWHYTEFQNSKSLDALY